MATMRNSHVTPWQPHGADRARLDHHGVVAARVWAERAGWSWAAGTGPGGWAPTRTQAQALADWALYELGRLTDAPRTV